MTLGLGLITICDKFVQFGFGKHKAKSIGESLDISLYRLIKNSRFHAIQFRYIPIQYRLNTTNGYNS